MKKFYSIFILAISFFAICNSTILAQNKAKEEILDDGEAIEKEYKGNDIFKAFFLDAGYGANKFGFGLGVRYWNLGFAFGVAGLGESIPSYQRNWGDNKVITPETAVNQKSYSSIHVMTDLYYFYDINDDFTAFVNLGFGVGSDSILANHKDYLNTPYQDRLFPLGSDSKTGINFGLGIQYFLEQWIGFGLGYHSRRGVYAQINYFWF